MPGAIVVALPHDCCNLPIYRRMVGGEVVRHDDLHQLVDSDEAIEILIIEQEAEIHALFGFRACVGR